MKDSLVRFKEKLVREEKSKATVEKYLRDAGRFAAYLTQRGIQTPVKEVMIEYKRLLCERYAPASVNSILASTNAFVSFLGYDSCKLKLLKIQRQMFADEKKELGAAEYKQLLRSARGTRLYYVIRTICETGIRVSELEYITVAAVCASRATVDCKSKTRVIFIPQRLKQELLEYINKSGIRSGCVFITRNGRPLDRSNIWREMKALCKKAGVSKEKIFPHNLRHLFARTFYSVERDIVRLADLLGHSSINTTRIYTLESGREHIECIERVNCRLTT